jgi:uncharacterized protein GlcG (DUF336 family)
MPRDFKKMTLDEALVGLEAMLAEAEKDLPKPVTMGVSDEAGYIICFYRMDGGSDIDLDMVMKKCFTSAIMGNTTELFLKGLKVRDYPFYEFNHPYATAVPGGVPIVSPDTERAELKGGIISPMRGQIGACAVSGRSFSEDEAIAKIGVEAIQRAIWGKSK